MEWLTEFFQGGSATTQWLNTLPPTDGRNGPGEQGGRGPTTSKVGFGHTHARSLYHYLHWPGRRMTSYVGG